MCLGIFFGATICARSLVARVAVLVVFSWLAVIIAASLFKQAFLFGGQESIFITLFVMIVVWIGALWFTKYSAYAELARYIARLRTTVVARVALERQKVVAGQSMNYWRGKFWFF